MSEVTPPIGEDDLHAYIDGQLDLGRRLAVERYLAENPEAAQRVAAYRQQREAIRAAFKAREAGHPTEHGGAAALLMYDDAAHHRISVLLRPMTPSLHAPGTAIQKDGVNARAWIDNGLGVAVVATMPRPTSPRSPPRSAAISVHLAESTPAAGRKSGWGGNN
jgi:anti-sigma factor RsiW